MTRHIQRPPLCNNSKHRNYMMQRNGNANAGMHHDLICDGGVDVRGWAYPVFLDLPFHLLGFLILKVGNFKIQNATLRWTKPQTHHQGRPGPKCPSNRISLVYMPIAVRRFLLQSPPKYIMQSRILQSGQTLL